MSKLIANKFHPGIDDGVFIGGHTGTPPTRIFSTHGNRTGPPPYVGATWITEGTQSQTSTVEKIITRGLNELMRT
ncbi:MAG: hypothetical protein LR015_14170 [Verrucomicrobia bacterium]|nr:hypothetical protein [Verrucomicrobiota bacterium]